MKSSMIKVRMDTLFPDFFLLLDYENVSLLNPARNSSLVLESCTEYLIQTIVFMFM